MVRNAHAPWKDEELLRQKYVVEDKTQAEIGEEWECSARTVSYWLSKFDIPTNDPNSYRAGPWRDGELLHELYIEDKLSTIEIGERLDCDAATVGEWLKRNGIRRRHKLPHYEMDPWGYEVVEHRYEHERTKVRVHRLLAVAGGLLKPNDLFNPDIIVHHKTNIPWDNRIDNLEVMSRSEHAKLHHGGDYKPIT